MPPPVSPVHLTEKILITAGGWEAIRHARALRETGKVSGAQWSPPLLQGTVQAEGREYRSGLKILTATNVENLCTCRPSREYGTICAHSLAVGLAILAGQALPMAVPPVTGLRGQGMTGKPALPSAPTLPYREDPGADARLHIILAPELSAAWSKNQLLVGLEIAVGGKRGMLGAPGLATSTLLREDYCVVEQLVKLTNSVPAGMSFVDRNQFLQMLGTLAGHPRLTSGRTGKINVNAAPLRPPLRAIFSPDGALELSVQWPADSHVFSAGARAWLLRPGASQTTLQPISPGLPAAYQTLLTDKSIRLPAANASAFLSVEWPQLEPFFELRADAPPLAATQNAVPATPTLSGIEPGQPQFAVSIEGSLNQLGARLQATYPNRRIITVGVTPERETFTYAPPGGQPGHLHTRNVPAERAARERLTGWGFTGPDTTGHYFLRGEDAILRFFALGMPGLQKLPGWQVMVGSRFTNVSKQIEIITTEVAVRGSGEDWFEMEIALHGSSGERFPAGEIQRLLQMGAGHTRLRNGKLAVLPSETLNDLQEVLRDCDPSQSSPGVYRLRKSQGAYVESSLEKWGVATAPSWEQWRNQRGRLQRPPDQPLAPALAAVLRPYQLEGVRWLQLLAVNGLGGILADEMGLGKTLQALAYFSAAKFAASTGESQRMSADSADLRRLEARRNRNPTSDPSSENLRKSAESADNSSAVPPSLIVCPTSLVDNWRREAARFTPELRTLAIDGPDRAPLFAQIPAADLVITSYALLRRDLDKYRAHTFLSVGLDEAHHIKNPDSQVAKAACALRSEHRFVLTGTPMENSVRDLWSIMHFALPGYLGQRRDFRERYELPLSRPGDPAGVAARERLTRRLRPVLLRRLKKDVAKDLPARIEQTAFCDLTPAQTEVYRQLLEQSRLKLDNARRDKNQGAGRMLVLTALLRLRQACCDLRLLGLPVDGGNAPARKTSVILSEARNERSRRTFRPAAAEALDATIASVSTTALPPAAEGPSASLHSSQDDREEEDAAPAPPSAKLALLDELLTEVRQGGHRVLIFSQFVSMLKILSAHLEAQETPFCYLDGSTKPKDRAAQVERFQTDESITAFLISVKAGGVGLNLTGADTVIHFDPWWNPAVEAQATDRAHRIGQTRVVTAYRLIARNTVEEKIFALQNRKKELTASLVERETDEPLLETLSFEEIESLLE